MPWKVEPVMSQRKEFVSLAQADGVNMSELCRRCGISRKTGHKLISRNESYGEGGLLDLSRAPHHHPNATPTQVAERIVEAKRKRPTWGPRSLQAQLQQREAARGPGPASSKPAIHALVQALSCTHQLTAIRSWRHGTQRPKQRRDEVEGRLGVPQCISQRRARRPRTARTSGPGTYSSARSLIDTLDDHGSRIDKTPVKVLPMSLV